MDNVVCPQIFKALTDVLMSPNSKEKDDSTLQAHTAKVVGQMLSVNSAHTRQAIIALLVYKPSITAKLFRKGEREKAIDLMKNGFDKLCGSESVSTLNPFYYWKPGAHLDEFAAWALESQTKQLILARLSQGLEWSTKELQQRCARIIRDDPCPFSVRWGKDKAVCKKKQVPQAQRLSAIKKRSVSC